MCFMGVSASVSAAVGSPAVKVSAAAARKCRRVVRAVVVSDIGLPSRSAVHSLPKYRSFPLRDDRPPANVLLSGSTPRGTCAAAPTESGTASGAARALPSAACQRSFDNIGREKREAQDPAHAARRDVLGIADVADRAVYPVVEHPLPSPKSGQRLDHPWLELGGGAGLAAIRRDDTGTAALRHPL